MTTFLHKVAREPRLSQISTSETPLTKETLVDMVLSIVAAADWNQPDFDGRLGRVKSVRGEVLLATLTYCYAWGIYSSDEIAAAIFRNRQNSELLDRFALDRKSFVQFRRHNRELLKSCLMRVLGEMTSTRLATHLEACEAEERISRAAECDCMEFDE
jgi:hypothetical protein